MKRDGKTIFRPDSGNPEYIICGNPNEPSNSPEGKGCLKLLDETFGSSINNKGYKQINSKVGLIWGDGMYLQRYDTVLQRMKEMGYASSNLVIGVGGILRNHSRDTLGFAIKATKVEVDGIEKSIYKDPITDKGKKSHKGYLCLEKNDSDYITLDEVTKEQEKKGLLKSVFRNGKLLINEDIYNIRKRIESSLSNNIIENNFKKINNIKDVQGKRRDLNILKNKKYDIAINLLKEWHNEIYINNIPTNNSHGFYTEEYKYNTLRLLIDDKTGLIKDAKYN